MQLTKTKLGFNNSAIYFCYILIVVIVGFWPSYFAKFFSTTEFSFYIHVHSTLLLLWLLMLILQPILIRRKQLSLHRRIGVVSYLLFPLMCISIILVVHQTHHVGDENLGEALLFQVKPFLIFVIGYAIAIAFRRNIDLHARGMVITGIALIEPALTRLILNALGALELFTTSPNFFFYASISAITIIFSCFIIMMILERHQKNARWVFPLALGLYAIFYSIILFGIRITFWENFAKWFISLPLT